MHVRERSDIDKLTVGGVGPKRNSAPTLAISMTVCRTGAAVKFADTRTDKFVRPVFSLNVINDESHVNDRLACQDFISVPIGAGCLAEVMITVTEVNHTLKFGHQEGRTVRCVQFW